MVLAPLPLRAGESWDREDRWRRVPLNAEQITPAAPSSASVSERTTVESLKDLVTVPAGGYRDCVRIMREPIIVTNLGVRERRVERCGTQPASVW